MSMDIFYGFCLSLTHSPPKFEESLQRVTRVALRYRSDFYSSTLRFTMEDMTVDEEGAVQYRTDMMGYSV